MRSNLLRNIATCVAAGIWVFMLLALASFHPSDWPSHAAYPYPATANLCGSAGAFVAYHLFVALGQGVFPLMLFAGVCVVLIAFQGKVDDLWLRFAGILLMSVAFAAAVHHLKPIALNGLPEG